MHRSGSALQTAKPKRPPTLDGFAFVPLNPTVPPNPSHGTGRVFELVLRGHQPDEGSIALANCALSATLKKNYMFAGHVD